MAENLDLALALAQALAQDLAHDLAQDLAQALAQVLGLPGGRLCSSGSSRFCVPANRRER